MDADYSDESLLALRPRLREDAVWLPLRGGIVFRTHAQSFRLVGEAIYLLAQQLLPRADGSRRVSEIAEACPSASRPHLLLLVRLLLQRGVLVDEPAATVVDTCVAAAFREPIAFVRHLTGHDAAFVRVREARVLLAGGGRPFTHCATTLLQSGVRHLSLCPFDSASVAPIAAAARELEARGLDAAIDVITTIDADADRPAWPSTAGYDIVAYADTRVRTRPIVLLNRECSRTRRSLLIGLALGRQTIVGPLIDGIVSGCWMCGFVRLAPDLIEGPALPDFLHPTPPDPDAPAIDADDIRELEALLGREMAFAIFKHLAGDLRPQTHDHVIVSTAEGGGSFGTRAVPHPLCACMRFCAEIDTPAGSEPQAVSAPASA